jgi:hypothetical protein
MAYSKASEDQKPSPSGLAGSRIRATSTSVAFWQYYRDF